MKVGFDGVLLGAWTKIHQSQRILDVGTGTGLVALMLAQRSEHSPAVSIKALETDTAASTEASFNFARSPWKARLESIHGSLQNFERDFNDAPFDLIVCNPPWNAGAHEEMSTSRQLARTAGSLPLDLLFRATRKLLAPNGTLSVIVPAASEVRAKALAEEDHLSLARSCAVRPLTGSPCHRMLLEFSSARQELPTVAEELTIEAEHHVYTPEFRELAQEFYLKF